MKSIIVYLLIPVSVAQAQNSQQSAGDCSPNIAGGGNVVICEGADGESRLWNYFLESSTKFSAKYIARLKCVDDFDELGRQAVISKTVPEGNGLDWTCRSLIAVFNGKFDEAWTAAGYAAPEASSAARTERLVIRPGESDAATRGAAADELAAVANAAYGATSSLLGRFDSALYAFEDSELYLKDANATVREDIGILRLGASLLANRCADAYRCYRDLVANRSVSVSHDLEVLMKSCG